MRGMAFSPNFQVRDVRLEGLEIVQRGSGRAMIDEMGAGDGNLWRLGSEGIDPGEGDGLFAAPGVGGDGVGEVKFARGEGIGSAIPPDDLLKIALVVAENELAVFLFAADLAVGGDMEVTGDENGGRVAAAEGGKAFDLADEGKGEVGQGERSRDLEGRMEIQNLCLAIDPLVEVFAKEGQVFEGKGETGSRGMATETGEERLLGSEGGGDIKTRDGTGGAAGETIRAGKENGRFVEAFDEVTGDDADDAGRPGGMVEDEQGVVTGGGILFDQLEGGIEDLADEQLTMVVVAFDLGGDEVGALFICSEEQLDDGVGICKAADGVETRGNLEADDLGGDAGGVEAGFGIEELQTGAGGLAQNGKSFLQQEAGVMGEGGDISNDAQGDEVEQCVQIEVGGKLLFKGCDEHEGDTDAGESGSGVGCGQEMGVDDGVSRGKLSGGDVMVGEDDLDGVLAGKFDGFKGSNAGVAG